MNHNIGFLIYTYNRVDDAKINLEIVRGLWEKSKLFSRITIVHAYNGKKAWYPKKYLEDDLVVIKNTGHYQGAAQLIDAGIARFQKKYPAVDYVIAVSADTWLIKPNYVNKVIAKMHKQELRWATCSWGLPGRNDIADVGSAVDFFIIDLRWAKEYRMFPLNYAEFDKKYSDLFLYNGRKVSLEKLIFARYLRAIYRQYQDNNMLRQTGLAKIFKFTDREPVHKSVDKDGFWIRKMYWPAMGLLTHHDPSFKKAILKKSKLARKTKNINKLLKSNSLAYYNKGVNRSQYKDFITEFRYVK